MSLHCCVVKVVIIKVNDPINKKLNSRANTPILNFILYKLYKIKLIQHSKTFI